MFMRLVETFAKLPRWLQPMVFGATLLFVVVAGRMVFELPEAFASGASFGEAAVVLLAATLAGGIGGLGYTLLGVPARKIPEVGSYAAGLIVVTCYMVPLLLFEHFFSEDPIIDSALGVACAIIVTIIFGLVMGHTWFEEE